MHVCVCKSYTCSSVCCRSVVTVPLSSASSELTVPAASLPYLPVANITKGIDNNNYIIGAKCLTEGVSVGLSSVAGLSWDKTGHDA